MLKIKNKYTKVVVLFATIAFTLMINKSYGFEVFQLTDNSFDDRSPSVYENTIAWETTDNTNTKIYYWNGNDIVQVSNDDTIDNYGPSLYDGKIAWSGGNPIGYGSEIFYWDGSVVSQISVTANRSYFWPVLYNGSVSWMDNIANSVIYYWNGQNISEIYQGNSRYPSLFDGKIAWDGFDGNAYQIYYFDGFDIEKITDNATNSYFPSLYNGTIAWSEQERFNTTSYIYFWNGTDITQITDDSLDSHAPSLYNGKITWQVWDGNDSEIYYWNGSNIFQITNNNTDDYSPKIYDDMVVWSGSDGNDEEIFYATGLNSFPPVATTVNASLITDKTASLNAVINPSGLETTCYFEYGETLAYGLSTDSELIGNGVSDIQYSEAISDLKYNAEYHFRVVATNSEGTFYSEALTFRTTEGIPEPLTGSATSVTSDSAELNGTIDPNGESLTYCFVYGTTANYGGISSKKTMAGGDDSVDVSINISGLEPGTTYHYSLYVVADNHRLTAITGQDKTFLTAADNSSSSNDDGSSSSSSGGGGCFLTVLD